MDWIFLFVVTVWKMRQSQIAYFKERKHSDLINSKRYEKLVDEEIKKRLIFSGEVPIEVQGNDTLADEPKQTSLFE